ncbi:MAG TPA: hypothetical protein VGN87_00855 [Paenibacillus sp.]|jgi:hypothetical protein
MDWGIKESTSQGNQKKTVNAEGTMSLFPRNSTSPTTPYNFTVIEGVRGGVPYTEVWLLVNAWYDYDTKRFKRTDVNNFSFGWQWQGGGTYPGEENIGDFINQGINLWKANGKKAYSEGDPARDQTGEDIGALQPDGSWREFGIMLGWNNHFMLDAYGGMTIGGAGFEIDGSGTSPFKRVSLGLFSGGSSVPNRPVTEYKFAYNGTMWNTQHGLWNKDEDQLDGYYYGLESPVNFYDQSDTQVNLGSARALMQKMKFVVKKLAGYVRPTVENWQNLFEIDQDGQVEINGEEILATFSRDDNPNGATTLLIPFPDASWNKDNMVITSFIGKTLYYDEHMKNKPQTWTTSGLLLDLQFSYYVNIHTSFKKVKKNQMKINPGSGITINGAPLNEKKVVDVALIAGTTDFNMNFPDSSWNKDNTMVLAVIGALSDGNRRQLGVNCTITPYGMYGSLGTSDYVSAQVILQKY